MKYNESYYVIFAAHALSEANSYFESVYIFCTDGHFRRLEENAVKHKVYHEDDVVIVDFGDAKYDGKNYLI
ncbi:E3 ubiquitin-protein ligase TRIM71-like (plasmid) [Acetobacter orientalis]|uniref:E3 ubiquitin-protein ligase TRIM71-like n=1 Tax=Acetobacter orientalis TaxID=146474 RepID=A0A2Z5ZME4_9PROT|nr:E3 ubiquitin-protein ligase TRIM71-like [Acetobacter orientalis]